ncbi:MAG: TAXI family TRAP transporter solute-binding subunit [Deltaproteobacteria bacterium]|nr:TAXI family TRAP transporter solute-binding subunit [Deltaproteobacteria bacterium]
MKTRKMAMVWIGVLLLCTVSGANAAEVQKYVWGSGPMGGLWRIGVGAAVQLINEQMKDKYFYTAAASGGGIENVRRMIGGEFDTTWAHTNVIQEALTGTGLFENQKPYKDMRAMIFMGDQAVCVVALSKSPIKSFNDLAGKKVNVGAPGGIGVLIAKSMFKALGIEDKVKLSFLNPEGAAQGVKDGHIDAALAPGSPFTPSFTELARSTPIRLIEPTKEEADKIEKGLPYMDLKVIAPNTAPGENADKPRKAFFWGQYWVAKASMPDQAVYDALKITQEPKNREMLTKVMKLWGESGPVFGPVAKMGLQLHPGALKYWKEKGAKLPPEMLK